MSAIGIRAAALAGAVLLAAILASPVGCAPTVRLGEDAPLEGGAPSFVTPDAAPDAEAGPREVRYCPSSKCPSPLLTCPSSRFLCDTDPTTDVKNCGGCGVVCPEGDFATSFVCSSGACKMQCLTGAWGFPYANCDGIADNGCETQLGTAEACSACGDKCADGVPCTNGVCGCPPPLVNCGGVCVNLASSDDHCGQCGNACEDHDGAPANAYYGCLGGKCDKLKCQKNLPYNNFEDCNGDLTREGSDGCEVDLVEQPNDEHCGGCNIRCTGDDHCVLSGGYQCGCPSGTRDCGSRICVDISRDVDNCGGCGRTCSAIGGNASLHGTDICNMGECGVLCMDGYADCNGNGDDGCEVSLRSDPRNCGGCNVRCDGVAGQACVDGHCVVEECGGVH